LGEFRGNSVSVHSNTLYCPVFIIALFSAF